VTLFPALDVPPTASRAAGVTAGFVLTWHSKSFLRAYSTTQVGQMLYENMFRECRERYASTSQLSSANRSAASLAKFSTIK